MNKATLSRLERDMIGLRAEMSLLQNLVGRMENFLGVINSKVCEVDGQKRRMDRIEKAICIMSNPHMEKFEKRIQVIETIEGLDDDDV